MLRMFNLSLFLGLVTATIATVPQPPTQFSAEYEFGVQFANTTKFRPFLRGNVAIDAPPFGSPGGLFLQMVNDGDAPFLFDTQLILTNTSQGYQAAGEGRCWDIGQLSSLYYNLIKAYIKIPSESHFVKYETINGYNCSVWSWSVESGYILEASVRVNDSALVLLVNTNEGVLLSMKNIVVGAPNPGWFVEPLDCGSPHMPSSESEAYLRQGALMLLAALPQLQDKLSLLQPSPSPLREAPNKPNKPPKLAQQWQAYYKFAFADPFNKTAKFPLLSGHVALDYPKRSARVTLQDDQDANMPFILQTTSLASQTPQIQNVTGYQFLTRGSCWQTPPGYLNEILLFNFSIPETAGYAGNGTVNGVDVEFWQWTYQADDYLTLAQRMGVTKKGYIMEFVIDVEVNFFIQFAISFFWTNSQLQVGPIPPYYFQPPIGCDPF